MITIQEKMLKIEHDAQNAKAGAFQNAESVDDIMNAMVELADLFAEQDDAIVELAEIISEV